MGVSTRRDEYDACAVYAAVLKQPNRQAARPLWLSALEALDAMEHRSGQLDGKSDGTGILVSVPQELWRGRLSHVNEAQHVEDAWYLSLVIAAHDERRVHDEVRRLLASCGFRLLAGHWDVVDGSEGIWTAALQDQRKPGGMADWRVLEAVEQQFGSRTAGFSQHLAPLKMRGDARALADHAAKLWGESFHPRVVIGHNRFSTNTTTELHRVQPFLFLAHNGEINTIERVRGELTGLGINPVALGSDSQTLDRALTQLSRRYGLTLAETLRLVSPPSPAVVKTWPPAWQEAMARLEMFWGPVVQGPQALAATDGRQLAVAVDAMGLRPLWVLETADAVIISSEAGVVEPHHWIAEPRMIGPGEVAAWSWDSNETLTFLAAEKITESLLSRVTTGLGDHHALKTSAAKATAAESPDRQAADGWTRDDLQMVKFWVENGQEPIASLGFDGPLAAFSPGIVTVSDYLQETVAVVTNPALDREREAEHFRLTTWLGPRPARPDSPFLGPSVVLPDPWLSDQGLDQVRAVFRGHTASLPLVWETAQSELWCAQNLARMAVQMVKQGLFLVILDDADVYERGELTLDPALAVAAVDQALSEAGLRRGAALVVRSGMIRNLHDAAVLLGLGAAALVPHALWAQVGDELPMKALNHGLEKILSTMGTHWLSGYGRNFSAIGLPREVGEMLGVETWAPPSLANWERKREDLRQKRQTAVQSRTRPPFITHFNPHVYKAAYGLVRGETNAEGFHDLVRDLERKMPSQLRHTLVFAPRHDTRPPSSVSLAVNGHAMPFVISSMSFGSQGENAFRAYAEAAKQLNIVAMNGEGGEIPDMVGRYASWRGYQVASGRFGINAGLLNGAAFVEIKIGQGAKPGEGGHLPGRKVSDKVAQARKARPGVDLISPSNNHDLYSIEDLRQLIDELKTVNPGLKVVVKVPAVPNIGTIAVGIVKAGADVITVSGFDGGTGAARAHALRHVGLPADVGLPLVHKALVSAGVRERVELWADGGVRSADDVLKFILLGANRVGFGTMAMVALGCTICRQCQKDTCHVGITTQIESIEEAHERGLKRFFPQEIDVAVSNLTAFFEAIGSVLQQRLGHLGFSTVEEAVGQWSRLRQWGGHEAMDYVGWLESLIEDRPALALSQVNGASVAVQYAGVANPTDAFQSVDRRLAGVWQSGRRSSTAAETDEEVVIRGVAGQGFGAFLSEGITCAALGGAQDGVGKGASGGRIWILKQGAFGGHAGKSLGYGAQGGVIVVQGSADSRAGVRLAGARVVIMGDGLPLPSDSHSWWDSAAIKGFGFEYMTRGEALVLADPGPWLASGMTGGTIYLRRDDQSGLTEEFLRSRLSSSAQVQMQALDADDAVRVVSLLNEAATGLASCGQEERARELGTLSEHAATAFVKVVPVREQVDQQISTE